MRAHKSTSAAVRNYFMIFIDLSVSVRGLGLSGSFRKTFAPLTLKPLAKSYQKDISSAILSRNLWGLKKKRGNVVQKKE